MEEHEVDFSQLGPATRLAIKVGLNACDAGISEAEEKLAILSMGNREREHWRNELHGWKVTRHQLLTQDYPLPYKPNSAYREPGSATEPPPDI